MINSTKLTNAIEQLIIAKMLEEYGDVKKARQNLMVAIDELQADTSKR